MTPRRDTGLRTDGRGSWYVYTDAEESGGLGVPGPIFSIVIPHGLPAAILAALSTSFFATARDVATRKPLSEINNAYWALTDAGFLTAAPGFGWCLNQALRLPRRGEEVRHG